jgi:hypothetical protein
MNATPLKAKNDLIQNIVFGISRSGAFQHNKIYAGDLIVKPTKDFNFYLKNKLSEVLTEIKTKSNYSEDDHYETLKLFVKDVSKANKHLLHDGKITLGTAQKLVNLYWKMSWLLQSNVPVPIHCPFDGIIIKGLGKTVKHIKWTKMVAMKEYKQLVAAAKEKSGADTLANWELIHYNVGNGIVNA